MDRFRGSRFGANSSKASASTVCQKCLKRGHYSYECKATVQDRPYASRPSRTQQLLNPKLAPKLNDENPNKLLEKQGVADGILAAKQAESSRGRKRSLDDDADGAGAGPSRKRSRSLSSAYSSDSVSTISTGASRSPSRSRSPPRRAPSNRDRGGRVQRQRGTSVGSAHSYDSESDEGTRRTELTHARRSTRDRSRSRSMSRGPSERYGGSNAQSAKRRLSPSYSNGRGRDGGHVRPTARSRSRSPYRRGSQEWDRQESYRNSRDNGMRQRDDPGPAPPARKERSLSPYSKRLALTRGMNG